MNVDDFNSVQDEDDYTGVVEKFQNGYYSTVKQEEVPNIEQPVKRKKDNDNPMSNIITVRLDAATVQKFKLLAAHQGKSVGPLAGELVSQYVKKNFNTFKKTISELE